MSAEENRSALEPDANEDWRKFMATCGKFAVATPPAITVLLSISLNSTTIAQTQHDAGFTTARLKTRTEQPTASRSVFEGEEELRS
jgi:hypothetical protein